jgi:hypothetical protein
MRSPVANAARLPGFIDGLLVSTRDRPPGDGHGWPRLAGTTPFVAWEAGGRPRHLQTKAQLGAWLRRHFAVTWHPGPGVPAEEHLFEDLRSGAAGRVKAYPGGVSEVPFWPVREDIYCTAPDLQAITPGGAASRLDGLLDHFLPAMPVDRSLIKAAFLKAF